MNSRIWGIIGGVALVLAFLSPLVLGNSKKIEQLFKEAEVLYERREYKGAIAKYDEAFKESKKFGANTERIDIDFITLANLKIAQCYYELGEETSDVRYYQNALTHVRRVVLDTEIIEYQEELTYLCAENLYKIDNLNQATSKFTELIQEFPQSQWIPNALYAMAEIAYQQDNCEKSLNTFQRLVTEFPESELIQEAERRIVELNEECNEPPPPPPPPVVLPDEEMYEKAFELQQQGKVYDAHELYTNLIIQYPDSEYVPHAYVGIAEIYLEARDCVNARKNYEKAIDSTTDEDHRIEELYIAYHRTYLVPICIDPLPDPSDCIGELFKKARLLRMEERWSEAAEIYEQLANMNLSVEDMTYSLYWGGRCYYEAARTDSTLFSRSVALLTELITDYENNRYEIEPYYYLTLAYTCWAEASDDLSIYHLVIDTFERANARYADSNDSTVQELLSQIRRLNRDADERLCPLRREAERTIQRAEEAIANASEENIDHQEIRQANQHLELAKHQERIRNYEGAIHAAQRTIEIIESTQLPPLPPSPQPYVDQGNTYLGQGELEKALDQVEQALDIRSNYAPALTLKVKIKERYAARGKWFFEEEKYDEAIEAFNNAININISLTLKEPHNYLGIIYIRQERYREAIDAFSKTIRIDVNFKEAYFNRGLAYLELREFEKAIVNAEDALRIDPYYEPARMLIEFITQYNFE